MTYQKQELHPCAPPEPKLEDQESPLRWDCPGCGAKWWWTPTKTLREVEWYGFLHLKHREVSVTVPGSWQSDYRERVYWEDR